MRLPAVLLGALVVPVLPLLSATPAQAALGTICVGPVPAGTVCNTTRTTIPLAIADSTSGDLIRVGPGSYPDGPYVLPAGVGLRGSGAGTGSSATVLSLPAGAQTYLTANGGNVSDLRVSMITGNGATGIDASNGSILANVVVYGAGASNITGINAHGATLLDDTVNVTVGTGNTALTTSGVNSVFDSTWNGGQVGYRTTGTDSVSRITVKLAATAVSVEGGTLQIDDSVLDLGTTGTAGLVVRPTVTADSAGATATYLTVVGGGGTSRGVVADASADGTSTATVTLTNSIVWGPAHSVVRDPGGAGTATFTVSRSDYQNQQGSPAIDGTNLQVDPAFVAPTAGNYAVRAGSPVIDKGAVVPGPSNDRDKVTRPFDGDKDGIPVPDMGAYELHDVTAPTTVVTAGPSGPTKDNTPVFTFRSGADAVFECQIDGSPFQACSSPVTTTPLPDGPHTFTVRAHDEVFNIEAKPPKKTFTVDTLAPNTTLTKKPQKQFFKQKVKFKFSSNEAGAKLQCKLDNRGWQKCSSPYRFNVKPRWHILQVRATDAAGNMEAKPAKYRFKRVQRRHGH
jgi:hypothetical protein